VLPRPFGGTPLSAKGVPESFGSSKQTHWASVLTGLIGQSKIGQAVLKPSRGKKYVVLI
jgi:hypothetical protein